MRPLSELPVSARRSIRGVFTDIDDTLSTDGRITGEAYDAMARLRAAGLLVIPITGRPAGWCDHIARMWPVDAVVGENGAFWFLMGSEWRVGVEGRSGGSESKLVKRYVIGDAERTRRAERLGAIGERILREVPGSAIASD